MPISVRDESNRRTRIKVSVIPAIWEAYIVTDEQGQDQSFYVEEKNFA
jgi:hypothetical protein